MGVDDHAVMRAEYEALAPFLCDLSADEINGLTVLNQAQARHDRAAIVRAAKTAALKQALPSETP